MLTDYKLEDDCVLHCLGKPSASVETISSSTVNASSSNKVSTVSSDNGSTSESLDFQSILSSGEMRNSVDNQTWNTALTTLSKLLNNIISNPNEEKYRKVKKGNATFNKKIGGLTGCRQLMTAVGFVEEVIDGEAYYLIRPSAEAWPKLLQAFDSVKTALSKTTIQATSAPPTSPVGLSGFSPSNSGMNQAAMNLLQNPNALQTMMSNPMVQQAMMNDPRIANNPMMRQRFEQISRDPAALQQLSRMMQDPTTRQMLNQYAGSIEGGLGAGAGGNNLFGGMPPASQAPTSTLQQSQSQQLAQIMANMNANRNAGSATQQTQQSAANATGGNDSQMTEEEMIAEAIQRSLRET